MIQLTQVRRVSPLRPLQTFSLANKVQGVYRPERNESYMTVNITAKKIQVTQAFSDYATKKIEAKLDRFFSGDADCKVTLSEQKNMITCEVTVRTAGLIFRSEQKATDKNDAFDACIDRIIRQIRKNKTRLARRLRQDAFVRTPDVTSFAPEEPEEGAFEIVRKKEFNMKPMTREEAILQMNLLEHTFFAFRDEDNDGAFAVVYKRKDGGYGLIEDAE